jgi:hypothetical protein
MEEKMTSTKKKRHETMLIFLVPQVVRIIAERHEVQETDAARSFYKSQLYHLLEQEETKMWHFSPLTLFNLYNDEVNTGNFVIPEEC